MCFHTGVREGQFEEKKFKNVKTYSHWQFVLTPILLIKMKMCDFLIEFYSYNCLCNFSRLLNTICVVGWWVYCHAK